MQGDFRIGERLVRPRLNVIEYNGNTQHLEPKVMQVLVVLAAHAGDVVTRQQIREQVWQNVFVGEDVLIRAISELRRAFLDDPRTQHTIQTVPKVGYRLLPTVEDDSAPQENEAEEQQPVPSTDPEELRLWQQELMQQSPKSRLPWILGATVVVLALALLFLVIWLKPERKILPAIEKHAAPAITSIPPGAGVCPIVPGATYEVENSKTHALLEDPVWSASNGTLIDQWKSNGGNNQRWTLVPNGAYWSLRNVSSGKMLDDPSGNRAIGVQVDQWEANHAPNQNWIILPVGDGSCKIISQSSGLLLDVNQGSPFNGTAVIQYTDNDGSNQHWNFHQIKK